MHPATIKWRETVEHEDDMYGVGEGTRAFIVTEGLVIHSGIAEFFPEHRQPAIVPLTSVDSYHTYEVTIYGVTIEEFLEVVAALEEERFDDVVQLTTALKERYTPQRSYGGRTSDRMLG